MKYLLEAIQMSNISTLKQQAEVLLEKLSSGKKFLLNDLNARLQTEKTNHPQDTVIQAVAHVVERLHDKNPQGIISQAELESIYQELVGLNMTGTRFREICGDLLLTERPDNSTVNEYHTGGLRDDPTLGEVQFNQDEEVKAGFEGLFDPLSENYNPHLAADAKDKVSRELVSLGFDRHRVRLAGGNSRFLIFAADLDTNRGAIRVYIPAESSGEKFPSVFVAGSHFANLTASNLHTYLEEAAFNRGRQPEVKTILATLDAATGHSPKTASQDTFEKVASSLPEENQGFSDHGVFTSLPDPKHDLGEVTIPDTPLPQELKPLASDIEENVVEAAVGYPQATVRLAKRMLVAEFTGMGFPGTQLRVAESTCDGFICEASLNTPQGKVNIEVPIEMKGNIPLMPAVFAKDDFIADFTPANLHAFASREASYTTASVNRSGPLMGMTLHELKDVITRAAVRGDLETCSEVMDVISERFDDNTYRSAVVDFQKMLSSLAENGNTLTQAYDDSDQFVKTPNSLYPVHKKLGRPAHELVRDDSGEYHLKSTYYARQNQEEEGAYFSTAKALLGE